MITEEAGLRLTPQASPLGPFKRPTPQGLHCSLLAIRGALCLPTTPKINDFKDFKRTKLY